MSKITIDLTEQQERFLKEFATKQFPGSKDNLITANPIHLVQTRRERVIDEDYDNVDIIKYIVPDWEGEEFETQKELVEAYYKNKDKKCPIPIVSFDEAYAMVEFIDIEDEEQVIVNDEDYFTAYGISEEFYDRVCIEYYFETVAVFFIFDEAKKYMKYQGHNLCHPRTYTIGGGYANSGEYNHFWKLLFDIGKKLNKEENIK